MESSSGLTKGAWTREEDELLKKCIDKYGEGKWHLIPSRAGLNRCRKSCRLRWLNYLKPNINRTRFTLEEVDLIVRLHKLLGNRWTLIAGRLPGRTANDIKNYWNTHLAKNLSSCKKQEKNTMHEVVKVNAVKPRAHAISRNLSSSSVKSLASDNTTHVENDCNNQNLKLLEEMLNDDDEFCNNMTVHRELEPFTSHSAHEELGQVTKVVGSSCSSLNDECYTSWSDLLLDDNIWDLLNAP